MLIIEHPIAQFTSSAFEENISIKTINKYKVKSAGHMGISGLKYNKKIIPYTIKISS